MSQSPRAGDEDLLKQTADCPVLFSRAHDLRAINKLGKRLGISGPQAVCSTDMLSILTIPFDKDMDQATG